MAAYLLWCVATVLARIIPLRPSYLCATAVADLTFYCWQEKRENAIDNMAHVLPEADQRRVRAVAKQSFRNYAKYLVDFIRAPKIRPEDLEGKVWFNGWETLEAARAAGKGILIVLMHFGNWELGGPVLHQRGYPVNVIAETFAHDKLNRMIVMARTTRGMHVIPLERAAFSSMRALRRNEVLGILIDRPLAENGISVQFFGALTIVPSGPARLALRTGARVIPAAVVRLNRTGDRLMALIEPNLVPPCSGDEDEDVRALTEAIMSAHEAFIRRFPDQWYMFRRMWPAAAQARGPEPALAVRA
jgi:lauroyl/myristoyl acyltransferase